MQNTGHTRETGHNPCRIQDILEKQDTTPAEYRTYRTNQRTKEEYIGHRVISAVLRIHLILMQIRILDPHWKEMDPNPDPDPSYNIFFCSFLLINPLGSAYFFRSGSRKPDPDPKTGYLKSKK